jgi:hypothetical protein
MWYFIGVFLIIIFLGGIYLYSIYKDMKRDIKEIKRDIENMKISVRLNYFLGSKFN